jgi:adenine-specific DNA-methyltransferase
MSYIGIMNNEHQFSQIKLLLGDPYFESEGCMLFCMDSVTAMEQLKSEFADLTVTSPPYNIGKEYEERMPVHHYIQWCESWIKSIHRITKQRGAFWLNVGYLEMPDRVRALPIPYLLWDKTPFYLIQEVVWNYGAGVAGRKFFSPRNEKLLWFVKDQDDYTFNLDDVRDKNVKYPNQKKNGKLKCNPLGKNPTDVWAIPKVTSGMNRSSKERTAHPAQFPLAMILRVILSSSNIGETVFDPFTGSGTTAIAALGSGRRFIGFEIREDYCKMAAERIERAVNLPLLDTVEIA